MRAQTYDGRARTKEGRTRLGPDDACCCDPPIGAACAGLYNPAQPFNPRPHRACFSDLLATYPTSAEDAAIAAYLATTSIDITLPTGFSNDTAGSPPSCFSGVCAGLSGATFTLAHDGGFSWKYLQANICYTSLFSRLALSFGVICEPDHSPTDCLMLLRMVYNIDQCTGTPSGTHEWRQNFTTRKVFATLDENLPIVFNELPAGQCGCKLGTGDGDLSVGPVRVQLH